MADEEGVGICKFRILDNIQRIRIHITEPTLIRDMIINVSNKLNKTLRSFNIRLCLKCHYFICEISRWKFTIPLLFGLFFSNERAVMMMITNDCNGIAGRATSKGGRLEDNGHPDDDEK